MTALARAVEALLFLSPEPLSVGVLAELTGAGELDLDAAIAEVAARHGEGTGIEVAEVAGGWALRTRAQLAEVLDRLRDRPPEDTLSPAALETLAVVGYLEPVTRPEISRLRGVAADHMVSALVERGLLEEAGRDGAAGAVLYRTTTAMQQRFELKGTEDLPPVESFQLTGEEAGALKRRLLGGGHLGDGPQGDG